jgi:hypothetical protein
MLKKITTCSTLHSIFLWIFSPIRHLTLDMLPSTFSSRLFTLDFLLSPSTFYPHPRLFTLALDIQLSTLDYKYINSILNVEVVMSANLRHVQCPV